MIEKVDKIQGSTQPDRTQAMVALDTARRFAEAQAQRVEPKQAPKVPEHENTDMTASHPRGNGKQGPSISRTYAQFEVDSKTHKVSVRIIDMESGDIVRTIPPDELTRLVSNHNLYRGLVLEWKM